MSSIYRELSERYLFTLITTVILLPVAVWPDIIEEPLPQAEADGLLFIITFEPETTEYFLVQCDLENKTESVVARGLGRYHDTSVSLNGEFFFFAGKLKEGTNDALYIMKRGGINDRFDVISEILLPKNYYVSKIVYDDWRDKLYVNYAVPSEDCLRMVPCIGVVNVDSKQPVLKELRRGEHYFEVVVAVSKENIYSLRRDEDGVSLVKKPKASTRYITLNKDSAPGYYFIVDEETGYVALPWPSFYGGDESRKWYVFVPFNAGPGRVPPYEHLIAFPGDSVFRLTSVQCPYDEYVVVEERYLSLWENPPRKKSRFLLLNLRNRSLSLFYERPCIWHPRDNATGAIKWINKPGTYNSVYSLKVVNN